MNSLYRRLVLVVVPTLLIVAGCSSSRGLVRHRVSDPAKIGRNTPPARLVAVARLFEHQGKWNKAKQLYTVALQRDPSLQDARDRLQYIASRIDGVPPSPAAPPEGVMVAEQAEDTTGTPLDGSNGANSEVVLTESTVEADTPLNVEFADAAREESIVDTSESELEIESATQAASASDAAEPKFLPPVIRGSANHTSKSICIAKPQQTQASPKADEELPVITPDSANLRKPLSSENSTDLASLCPEANTDVIDTLHRCESGSSTDKVQALTRLSEFGPDAVSAKPALIRLLDDSEPEVQSAAAHALWLMDGASDQLVASLIDLLKSPEAEVSQQAAYILGSMGPEAKEALPKLRLALIGSQGAARLHFAEAIMKIDRDDRHSVAIVANCLRDQESQCRVLAAYALGDVDQTRRSEAIEALSNALHDEEAAVRAAAALSLGAFGSNADHALSTLAELQIQEEQEDVQNAIAVAMNCIRSESDSETLK